MAQPQRRIFNGLGADRVGDRILRVSRRLAFVDEIFCFSVDTGRTPKILASASVIGFPDERTSRYLADYHKSDPLYGMIGRNSAGDMMSGVLNAAEIKRSDYRKVCYDRPGLQQKISFASYVGDVRIHCNFYLQRPAGFSAIAHLKSFAPLALQALGESHRLSLLERGSVVDRLESRLRAFYPDLTMRERQVCARTIAGWSAEATASDLGIGTGSVLTYRRRAYARYGYSTSASFLERILD